MNKIELEYNGKTYILSNKDIPHLNGNGKIVIQASEGSQSQKVYGSFSNLSCYQDGKRCFVNGVDIGSLVKRLELNQTSENKSFLSKLIDKIRR